MLCHPVLPYSNWEWATVCHSESLAALKRGVQEALFRLDHAQWTKAGRCVFYDNAKEKDVDICFRPFDKKRNKQEHYYLRHPLYKDFVWFIDEVVGIDLDDIIKDSNYRTFSNSIYFWWLENFISSENASIVPRFEESDDAGTIEYLNTIFKRIWSHTINQLIFIVKIVQIVSYS